MYGSAMPHSHHVGLNLEKTLATNAGTDRAPRWVYLSDGAPMAFKPPFRHPDAERWYEWGTALKPGFEPIVLARRPLDGTVVDNALTYGTGALNIGGCRIPVLDAAYAQNASGDRGHAENRTRQMDFGYTAGSASEGGRWPANIVHDGSAEVLAAFGQYGDRGAAAPVRGSEPSSATKYVFGDRARQPGAFHGDEGTAARFFQECPWDDESLDLAARFYFSGKTSRSDRNEGCEHLAARPLHWSSGEANPGSFQSEGTDKKAKNHHPTVKPTSLMRWLTRLVTPPGGLVLDPFMGSGSTGKAAMLEGFRFLGMEAEPDYMEIAHARVALGLRQAEEATRQGVLIKPAPPPPSPLLRAAPRPQIDLFAAE
jgi:site-specific DNA-methyltransferase (adenine-specific)